MNNREIKFRIWDKQNKTWLENSSSLHCYSNWTICPFTGNLVDYIGLIDGDNNDTFYADPADDYYLEGTKLVKEPRYIVQQYTGLKDSKGVEIYEGDIVDFRTLNHENITIDSVVFSDGAFILENIIYNLCDVTVKIVGNIMQNSELIKSDDE